MLAGLSGANFNAPNNPGGKRLPVLKTPGSFCHAFVTQTRSVYPANLSDSVYPTFLSKESVFQRLFSNDVDPTGNISTIYQYVNALHRENSFPQGERHPCGLNKGQRFYDIPPASFTEAMLWLNALFRTPRCAKTRPASEVSHPPSYSSNGGIGPPQGIF